MTTASDDNGSARRSGVGLPPPSRLDELTPPPRLGYAWAPGYWGWSNERHVWISGHWEPERRGYHWVRHHWVQRDGRWYLQRGGWAADELRRHK